MATASVLENETGTLPPAFLSPGDPASPGDQQHQPGPPAVPAGLRAETDILLRTVARLGDELAGLRRAMATRAVIDQAKGALRAATGLSDDEAFALLSARSQHANRKLVDVAGDVLAALHDAGGSSGPPVPAPPARGLAPAHSDHPGGWRTRRCWDAATLLVTDADQLRALTVLGGGLAAAGTRADVHDVLLRGAVDALGAFAAALATAAGDGSATVEVEGVLLGGDDTTTLSLAAQHPGAEVLRTARPLLLARADLALRFPAYPRPERLRSLVVLPVGSDTGRPAAWLLHLDLPGPLDRGTTAFFDQAARLASAALARTG